MRVPSASLQHPRRITTIIAGDPGVGKSFLSLYIASLAQYLKRAEGACL